MIDPLCVISDSGSLNPSSWSAGAAAAAAGGGRAKNTPGRKRGYVLPPEMAVHMEKVDGTWRCIPCMTNFRDRTDCRRHVEAKHLANSYTCDLCGHKASTKYYFRKHQLQHQNIEKQLETVAGLTGHELN